MILPVRPKTIIFTGFEHKKEEIEMAKKKGFYVVLLTQKIKESAFCVFDEVIEVDLYKKKEVDALIPVLKEKFRVKALVSNYEKYVVPRSYIAEKLGVVGTSVYSACCTRNKALQRYALSVLPENIDWRIIRTEKEFHDGVIDFGGKAFLKFTSGVKSRAVYSVDKTKHNLSSVWESFQKNINIFDDGFQEDYAYLDFRFSYPDPKSEFLLEKAVSGKQITVASFAGSHCIWHMPSVCDVYTARDCGIDDSFLAVRILPSKESEEIIKEAYLVTETASQILGLRYCGIHSELLCTDDGSIKIIEIASRIGGYRETLYSSSYGISLSQQIVNAAIGRGVTVSKAVKQYTACIEIFPKCEGLYKGMDSLESYIKNGTIQSVKIRACIGDRVGKACDGFSAVCRVVLTGKTYDAVYEAAMSLSTQCRVWVEQDDAE